MTINGQDVSEQFILVCSTSLILIGATLFVALAYRSLRASDPQVLMRNKVSLLFGVPAGIFTFIVVGIFLIPRQLAQVLGRTTPYSSALPALVNSLLAVVTFSIYMALISTLGAMLGLIQAPPDIPHMRRLSLAFDKALGALTRLFGLNYGGPGAA